MVTVGVMAIGLGILLFGIGSYLENSAEWNAPGRCFRGYCGGSQGYYEQYSNATNLTYFGMSVAGAGVIVLGIGVGLNTAARFEQYDNLTRSSP